MKLFRSDLSLFIQHGFLCLYIDDLPDNAGKIDTFLARKLTDVNDREAVRKVSAALFRRGFSWEEIRAALRRFDSSIEEE